jgi:acyl-[acyl-carrier-protein]-phospholipid O-acyltransferase/long-chain-fatty-acid--[acyl-carrier-protein] ligase
LFRLMGVIPVSSKDSQKEMFAFIRETRTALKDGYMLCIFAEGAVTRNGMMQEFKPGLELIARGGQYPIIPVYIGGAWGSILSYAHGRLLSRLPVRLPYPVTVLFGKPMPAASTAAEIRHAVIELSADYFESKKRSCISLGEAYIISARRNWKAHAISDTSGKSLTYGMALAGSLTLSVKIKNETSDQKFIGIMLPASVGGAISNLAVSLLGKVPVNLNYTAPAASIMSSIEQCGIKYIITSKAFKEKLRGLPAFAGEVYLEDIAADISPVSKISAWAKARFMPRRMLAPKDIDADDLATVIFSSGSTGEPKGIMLTHHNIQSNIEALKTVLGVKPSDNICAALPMFHSLGFTGTLWLPLLSGFSAAYHPNPLDGTKIAEVVRSKRSTLLLATPTFLTLYTRAAKPDDFASLRLVVAGAEKLKEKVARNFQDKFGIRPLEGYGATELSPVVALSLPDTEIDGVFQKGAKEGSVGHPLPGVAVEIEDLEEGTPLPAGEHGLIKVKGPNVMKGYLGRPGLTEESIKDGWYITGDIGWLDNDGFLYITDRLSRFSKIGGEMVPHGAVEDALQDGLGQSSRLVAVTSVPDEIKGERLVVLYQKGASEPETLRRIMAESLLPNLWRPCRDCYIEVDSIPILGSGKLDIQSLRRLASATVNNQVL